MTRRRLHPVSTLAKEPAFAGRIERRAVEATECRRRESRASEPFDTRCAPTATTRGVLSPGQTLVKKSWRRQRHEQGRRPRGAMDARAEDRERPRARCARRATRSAMAS
jgi:hypothetical protein